jgi:16S rRNA (cytosine967-C5)-methyltransferase
LRCLRRRSKGCWIREATAARRAALDILRAVGGGAPFADARDRAVHALSERDRRLAHELSAGVLRARRALDGALDLQHADPRLHDILRLGAYQLHRLTRVPAHAAVSTSVELAREAAGEGAARYVNRALRHLANSGSGESAVVSSHPEWLVARWREQFGAEETDQLMAWNDRKPPLVLQPVQWDAAKLRDALTEAGYAVASAPFEPGLVVSRSPTTPLSPLPTQLPGYAEGAFIVQDPAQALVARFAAVPSGSALYDACAAPGGKTVALARGGARVTAGEARSTRLARLSDTLRRTGVAVPVVAADLLSAPFGPGSWDVVLLDAPCSATGTIARHPDARWRLRTEAIAQLARRQAMLLDAAAELVRPDGILVYATCSLEREENEDQVEDFLARRGDYRRAPRAGSVPAELVSATGDLRTLPMRHGIDGVYAARLVRAAR